MPGFGLPSGHDAPLEHACGTDGHSHVDREPAAIEVGKYADFVVLDADSTTLDAAAVAQVQVRATNLSGVLVCSSHRD